MLGITKPCIGREEIFADLLIDEVGVVVAREGIGAIDTMLVDIRILGTRDAFGSAQIVPVP